MRKLFAYILFLCLICLSVAVYGYFDSVDRVKFHGFDGEGSFVEGPSYTGAAFGYVIGILPAAAITQPQRFLNYDQTSDEFGVCILSCFAKPLSVLFGGFPYLLKKGFWDFPKWVIVGSDKSKDYYEYKPTPIPETKVDYRLLQEKEHANLNLQDKAEKPSLIEIPEAHKKIESAPVPELQTMKEVKSISEQHIPSSTVTDTSLGNVPGGYSIDTEKIEDKTQKWESSGLPDWVKKQVSQ